MALSVWGEGEERAEPREVSGQTAVSFSFSSLFFYAVFWALFFFTFLFRATSVITLVKNSTAFYTGLELVQVYFS